LEFVVLLEVIRIFYTKQDVQRQLLMQKITQELRF